MKLLSMDPAYRIWLNSRFALAFDNDLNEVFVGLTHVDSVFFAESSIGPYKPAISSNVDTLIRFLRLHKSHESALALLATTRGSIVP